MSKHYIEDFDQCVFVKEIRTFMEKHDISTREFARFTKTSPTTLQRLAHEENGLTIKAAQNFLNFMKTYDA